MFAVLADDLTGAFDVAEHAFDLVAAVRVHASPDAFAASPGEEELAVVSTGTRHLSPGEAVRAAAAALRTLGRLDATLLFAKYDSTLRGHVKAELAALGAGRAGTRFCPANPALGRTVEGGRLLVGGTPVERTGYARDPMFPATDDLPPCADARDGSDLDRVAAAAESAGELLAGSSALFRAALLRRRAPLPGLSRSSFRPRGRTLYLNGSLNPAAAADESPFLARGAAACRLDALPADAPGDLVVTTRGLPGYRGLAPFWPALLSLLGRSPFATLVVSGGETLAEFFRLAGVGSARVAASVAPGIPAVALAVAGREATLVPKPGGFPLPRAATG